MSKKSLWILLIVLSVVANIYSKETSNWTAYPSITLSDALPSSLDIYNTGLLTATFKLDIEYREKLLIDVTLPVNLVFNSNLNASEDNYNTMFFISHPSIEIGFAIKKGKLKRKYSIGYSFPVKRCKEIETIMEKDKYHRLNASYKINYISDPVAINTGIAISSSVPFKEDNKSYYELPDITVPCTIVFSINSVVALEAGTRFEAVFPSMTNGSLDSDFVEYRLIGFAGLIMNFGKRHVSLLLQKNLEGLTSQPVISFSYGQEI